MTRMPWISRGKVTRREGGRGQEENHGGKWRHSCPLHQPPHGSRTVAQRRVIEVSEGPEQQQEGGLPGGSGGPWSTEGLPHGGAWREELQEGPARMFGGQTHVPKSSHLPPPPRDCNDRNLRKNTDISYHLLSIFRQIQYYSCMRKSRFKEAKVLVRSPM